MIEILITSDNKGRRVDKFIHGLMPAKGLSFYYKMFRKKNIVLNDKKISGSELLKENDIIKIYFSDDTYQRLTDKSNFRFSLPFVVFEDENILVIDKAAGIFSQPAKGKISVIDQIKSHYANKGEALPIGVRVGISNRLDVGTTGIIISGKKTTSIHQINAHIKNHKVKKKYLALVHGEIKENLSISNNILKDGNRAIISNDGKDSRLDISVVKSSSYYTLVEVSMVTGRFHQIRATMADISHPIVGDRKYGHEKHTKGLSSQLLHCSSYEFLEKICNKKYEAFKCEPPTKFTKALKELLE